VAAIEELDEVALVAVRPDCERLVAERPPTQSWPVCVKLRTGSPSLRDNVQFRRRLIGGGLVQAEAAA